MNMVECFDLYSEDRNIHDLAPAGSANSRSLNDIMSNVQSLSRSLMELGLKKGDRILILLTNGFEMIEALLATANIGAVAVPLSPQAGTSVIGHVIRNCRPRACFLDAEPRADHQEALSSSCSTYIATSGYTPSAACKFHDYHTLLTTRPSARTFPRHDDSDVAIILHTSGSSGVPKAITRSHGVMISFLEYFVEYYEAEAALGAPLKPHILTLPLSHMGGLLICLNALLAKRPLFMMRHFHPAQYLKLVAEHKLDSLMLIPTMYSLLVKDDPALAGLNFDAVKYCYIGAEACPDSLVEQIWNKFGALPLSTYGATECLSGIGYSSTDRESATFVKGSCGKLRYGEAKLVDSNGIEHPEFGELWVRNRTVEECYLDEDLNRSKFVDGWYRTGDAFFRDGGGNFFWKGRVDDMFICKGNNIYPIEIEKVLLDCSFVEAACISPIKDAEGNTLVAALAVVEPGITDKELMQYLLRHAPAHAAPRFVLLKDSLPSVGIGKVDRRAAAAMLQDAYSAKCGMAGSRALAVG